MASRSRVKLDARTGTAIGKLLRCWLECRSSDIEKRIDELAETNAMLFKMIEEKRAKDAGNGGGEAALSVGPAADVLTLKRRRGRRVNASDVRVSARRAGPPRGQR
jgi:hypothetical protein